MKSHHALLLSCALLLIADFQSKAQLAVPIRSDSDDASRALPARWQYQPEYMQTLPSDDPWWKQYGDTTLDRLISRAETNNYNVSAALKRIDLARRQITDARSALYPNLGVSAGWSGSRNAGSASGRGISSQRSSSFSAGANMNWEIDVFGRVASKVKAAKAGVDVSRAEYDGVIVSLCAELASEYFQLRTYQQQYQITLEHIESQKADVRMTQVRHEAGIGSALEVAQAQTVLYSTESTLPALESSIQTTANSIAILTGVYPAQLAPELTRTPDTYLTPAPPVLSPGVPMELLRRRPDVVQSEMQLAQYAAQIGVARKDFLPVLALSGSIGTSAHYADDLFGKNSLDYSIGATLSWTIFDGFARSNNVAEARLQLEAATDDYNFTILTAVEEVENAISVYNSALRQAQELEKVVEQSRRAYQLSVDQYKDGITDFINVTDSQVTYLSNRLSLASAIGSVYTAQVALYKALGGGITD